MNNKVLNDRLTRSPKNYLIKNDKLNNSHSGFCSIKLNEIGFVTVLDFFYMHRLRHSSDDIIGRL